MSDNDRDERIKKAVLEVKENKLSLRAAAKKYGLPKSTLCDHTKGKSSKSTAGRQTVFSKAEEAVFAAHASKVAEWGFPLTRLDIRLIIKMYLDKEGRVVPVFKDNLPGEDWVTGFMDRNSDLRLRMSRNITYKRAMVSPDDISKYFDNLKQTIADIPPKNLLNYDETNLSDDPGSKKCIFKRGTKYPERILNSSKSCVSIMFAGTASGDLLPPYVCYKAERMYDTWALGGPPGARYNRSKSGWIDEQTFTDWFKTVVVPWAKSLSGEKAVIGDNLSSHFSLEVVKMCEQHNIKFVCLPPNATHLLQPLDVAFFRPLKGAWREILLKWKMEADRRLSSIPKNTFPSLLNMLCEAIKPNEKKNLESGFRACGIYPFNPQHVLDKVNKRSGNEVLDSPSKRPKQLVGEAVIDFLSNLRHSPGEKKTIRKKKVNVPPGLSISSVDLEDPDQSLPSTSGTAPPAKKKRLRQISSSSDEGHLSLKDSSDELQLSDLEPPPEEDPEVIFKDPVVGDWLLVKFPGKRDIQYYVGVVDEVIPDGLNMTFARKMSNQANSRVPEFKWPQPEDKSVIDYDQIEKNVGKPTFNYKNDRLVSFKFKYSFDGYIIN